MNTIQELTYENIHAEVSQISPASISQARKIIWLDSDKTFGVARDTDGRVEIFLFGNELIANFDVVAENMDYHSWAVGDLELRQANRIRLPKEVHFEAFAAFLCILLIENGVFQNPTKAFGDSEPTIALAYEKNKTSIQAQIGLIGELLLILNLLVMHPSKSAQIVDSWKGHDKSLRDFQFNGFGVEVKTSTTLSSRHHIQGLHQVEGGLLDGQSPEHSFYLLSLGIAATIEEDSSFTIYELIENCLQSISIEDESLSNQTRQLLIEKSESYLHGFGINFSFVEPDVSKHFDVRWRSTFVRAYDMNDSNIRVLTSASLAEFPLVLAETLSFDINLPTQVSGDLNPISGFHNFVSKLSSSLVA